MSGRHDRSAPDDAAQAIAGRRGKRIAVWIVIGLAVLFIGSSAAQIVPAVFGLGVRPLPDGPPGSSARTCAEGVRSLSQRLEAGQRLDASGDTDGRLSAWDTESPVGRACASSPEGLDAWAALLRLRTAREQRPHAPPAQLDSMRRDVWAHLPADLR
jgi:hypothetical protein